MKIPDGRKILASGIIFLFLLAIVGAVYTGIVVQRIVEVSSGLKVRHKEILARICADIVRKTPTRVKFECGGVEK
jgi:hypothetical protein